MENINVFDMEDNRLLTTKQAATLLGYKVSYVYNLVYSGLLKPYKCGNRPKAALRFLKRDLEQFLGRHPHDN